MEAIPFLVQARWKLRTYVHTYVAHLWTAQGAYARTGGFHTCQKADSCASVNVRSVFFCSFSSLSRNKQWPSSVSFTSTACLVVVSIIQYGWHQGRSVWHLHTYVCHRFLAPYNIYNTFICRDFLHMYTYYVHTNKGIHSGRPWDFFFTFLPKEQHSHNYIIT